MTTEYHDQVRQLYEAFPYPAPTEADQLIEDLADTVDGIVGLRDLPGWRILDAGCGTGHRLVALALRHPEAQFVGFDSSASAVEVARGVAHRHGATNLHVMHGTLPDLELGVTFDLVLASGVVHHLPDPHEGLRWLADRMSPDGLIYLWLYHAIGEHDRLVDRELVRLLAGTDELCSALAIVRELGFGISPHRYGPAADGEDDPRRRDVRDVDALLNPCVFAWRAADVPGLLEGLPCEWVAVNGLTWEGGGRPVDLGGDGSDAGAVPAVHLLRPADIFIQSLARERVLALPVPQRLAALELLVRPTGFSVVAGRGTSLGECVPRLARNLIVGRPDDPPRLPQADCDRRRRRMVRVELRESLIVLAEDLVRRHGAAAARIVDAIEMAVGAQPHRYTDSRQRPALFHVPALPTSPWVDPAAFPATAEVAATLERSWQMIRDDLDRVADAHADDLRRYLGNDYLTTKFSGTRRDDWRSIDLFANGRLSDTVADCPATAAVLTRIAPAVSGEVILSRLLPGTVLPLHYDDNNYQLTMHLGLRVPADCAISVGGETRRWEEGRCLLFSDAYPHEVFNHGDGPRDCVLVDLWHPDLTNVEIEALRELRRVLAAASTPDVFERF